MKRTERLLKPVSVACFIVMLHACSDEPVPAETTKAASDTSAVSPVVNTIPERQVLFGDVHLHSRWSFDAFSLNVAVGPEEAYRFGRGEAISHV